jgi:hypothetical protein
VKDLPIIVNGATNIISNILQKNETGDILEKEKMVASVAKIPVLEIAPDPLRGPMDDYDLPEDEQVNDKDEDLQSLKICWRTVLRTSTKVQGKPPSLGTGRCI